MIAMIIIIGFLANDAGAVEPAFTSGNTLRPALDHVLGNDFSTLDTATQIKTVSAASFVQGVALALHVAGWVNLPSGSTNEQYAKIVIQFLDNNPKQLHMDASTLITQALGEAYPGPIYKCVLSDLQVQAAESTYTKAQLAHADLILDLYQAFIPKLERQLASSRSRRTAPSGP
jgi:hypothetical protein